MEATWEVVYLKHYISKNNKNNVVYSAYYKVSNIKEVDGKTYYGGFSDSINFDLEIVEAVDAVDAVLYTDKDTLLADKAVKIGDIKTPAVEAVEAKNPWANVDFVEYDDLTEDVVIGWIKSTLGEDEVKQIEDNIAAQIDAQENPPAATKGIGVPW
jgi:hypothetical protein